MYNSKIEKFLTNFNKISELFVKKQFEPNIKLTVHILKK